MHKYDFLIIGGGIAGTTAAETIRRKDASTTVAVIEDEPHFLYSRVFLPAFARGEIGRERVMLRSLADYEKKRIDLYLSERALHVDFLRQECRTSTGNIFAYKKLLIAAGGRVAPWEFENDAGDRLLRLQRLEDAERIRALGAAGQLKRAVVIGAGFIALEFLNIFRAYGAETTLLYREEHFWKGRVDREGAALFSAEFAKNRIEERAGDDVYRITHTGEGLQIVTKKGMQIEADVVAVGNGIRRNMELGMGTLQTGEGIKVNEFLETNVAGVWAAGDSAEYFDACAGKWKTVGNWTHGFLTGRIAGVNMLGGVEAFLAVPAYSITALGNVLTVVGEAGEGENISAVARFDSRERKYSRFFLQNGKIIGAVLINSFQAKPALAKLIESRKDFSGREGVLADPRRDLATL